MIDGFTEVFNAVYIAKKLYDLGKYDIIAESFSDLLCYDYYYDNMLSLIPNLFQHYYVKYYDRGDFEIHILSDPVIVDFYVLAGKYGRRENIPDDENPYIIEAVREVNDNLYISHELDWVLKGHTEPQRPFHSRIALFISYTCGCLDVGVLVYRLIEIYEWFANKCVELTDILDESMGGTQISLLDTEVAA